MNQPKSGTDEQGVIEQAYRNEVAHLFEVLVDNLVPNKEGTGLVSGQTEEEVKAEFKRGLALARKARTIALDLLKNADLV